MKKGMSMEAYLANPALGSSSIKLAHKSLRLLKDYLDGVFTYPKSPALSLGTLAHLQLLEPEKYREMVVDHGPINPRTGGEYGRGTKAWEDWELANPGVMVADPDITRMIERCPPEIIEIIKERGAFEQSFISKGRMAPYGMKCRCDVLVGTTILDLKTTTDIDQVERAITKYKYWISHAWYRRVMKEVTGKSHSFRFIFAEKALPHRWKVVDLAADYIMYADSVINRLIGRIEDAIKARKWDDSEDPFMTVGLPDWMGDEEEDDDAL